MAFPSKGRGLKGESQGHWEGKAEGRRGSGMCQEPLSRDECDAFGQWGSEERWGLVFPSLPRPGGDVFKEEPLQSG